MTRKFIAKSRNSIVILATLSIAACTATPEEIAKRQQFETQLANVSLSVAKNDISVAALQCLRDIAGKPVDEAALASAGYVKTKAVLGGISYKKSISPAGFAKYENSRRVVAGDPGGSCRFEAVSGSSIHAYRAELEAYLRNSGYSRASENGGVFGRTPRYTGNGLNFTVSMRADRGAPISGFEFTSVR